MAPDFTVRGSGEFPLDMLRYDECFPADATSASNIKANACVRWVRLCTHKACPSWERWESFGWKVVQEAVDLPDSA